MFKIRIFDISLTKAGFVLFVSASEEGLVLPIVIGISEAQSITMALNNIQADRPLTHDLFKTVLNSFQARIIKVVISKCEDGIFFSDLYMSTNDGTLILDSRTSDAIAMAVRYNAPIYVTEEIMNRSGVVRDESSEPISLDSVVSETSVLEDRLEDAVKVEKYEEAAILRDQLNRLKSVD